MCCARLLKDKQMRVKYNNNLEPLLSFSPAYDVSERDKRA